MYKIYSNQYTYILKLPCKRMEISCISGGIMKKSNEMPTMSIVLYTHENTKLNDRR